ncbi:hypothetical protein GF369_03395 [Candidatus Peregrinibacteria bacterium]|nr:hypothetical protein [Candidatus Peregrinibacteria bacterium]
MTETTTDTTKQEALLNAIEDGLAEFILGGGPNRETEARDDNTFFWPLKKLPEAIQVGDKVHVSLELTNKEQRQQELKKKQEQEEKYAAMRKRLEELVN